MAIPVITSATTDSAVTGSAYSYQITATNSPTSFGAYATAGFPAGLTIDSATGIISGTPTAAGTFAIKISALNVDGSGKATLRLNITAAAAPVITSSLTASGTVGTAFSYTITASGSPTSFGAISLPPGLSFTSPVISGTPGVNGTSNIIISATNSGGTTSATLVLTVVATAGSPVITSPSSINVIAGVPFTYKITATNTPTQFSADGLPAGTTITGDTISGSVSYIGVGNVTLYASNGSGTGSAPLAINSTSGIKPTIPTGLSYLATHSKPLAPSAFGPSVDMISLGDTWARIEPTEGVYDWTYLDSTVRLAAANNKQALIRITTMGGFASLGGSTPDWVATALGVDPASNVIVPGVTYTSGPTGQYQTIPVFFNSIFVGKKISMLQAMGDHFINGTTLTTAEKGAIKVFGVSFINASTEDWSIPNSNVATTDPLYNNLSEVQRWTNAVDAGSPGAGYTSAQMLATGEAIIDATVAACGDRFISLAIASNGTTLDLAAAGSSALAGNWMALAIHDYEATTNPGRMIYQRQSVASAQTPAPPPANTVWEPIYNFHLAGDNVAGQMLWFVSGDTTYRVNKGTANDPDGIIPTPPGLTYGQILQQSGKRAVGYGLSYVEVYRPDFEGLPDDTAAFRSLILSQTTTGQPPVITSANVVTGTVGVPFTYQIQAANGPTSFGVDVLPDGLTLNPMTGLISGTPISSVTLLTVTVSATNAFGTGYLAVKFKINGSGGGAGSPVITSPLDVTTEINLPFSYQITATNNPTDFQIIAGLPVELTLSPTGLISGTPLVIRDYNIKFSVRNAVGGTSAILVLHVVATGGGQPAITSPETADATLNVPFNYQITATNNPTSFGADALPDGLTLGLTGLISGTPTVRGVFVAQISATNDKGTGGIELAINVRLGVISPPIVRYHVSVCPESSAFSEDFIVDVECCNACSTDEAVPPYPPTKLIATTPGIPGSGTASFQWTPPANSL